MDTCSEGKVVAAINGVTDAGVPEEGTRVGPTRETRVCGADAGPVRAGHAEREAALVERSPIERAHKIRVPVRIFQGGRDQISNVEDVREFQRRIEASGGECTLTVYENDMHLLCGHREEVAAETLAFLAGFEQ